MGTELTKFTREDRQFRSFRECNGQIVQAVEICQETPIEIENNDLISSTPKITIINSSAGAKKTHNFQSGVKQFTIRSEKVTEIKYNYNETDYDGNIKATITSGGVLEVKDLKLNSLSIYFDTDKNADVEIIEWS